MLLLSRLPLTDFLHPSTLYFNSRSFWGLRSSGTLRGRRLVIGYRHFGTACQPHLQAVKLVPVGCPVTAVINCHSTSHDVPGVRRPLSYVVEEELNVSWLSIHSISDRSVANTLSHEFSYVCPFRLCFCAVHCCNHFIIIIAYTQFDTDGVYKAKEFDLAS